MSYSTIEFGAEAIGAFDQLIDVRSPAEFADDHMPNAKNLPVLDNVERARIGTIYKQVSKFEARRQGGALVAANISRHLCCALADRPPRWRPLIYCWRGGLRSAAMATVLNQVGWRAGVLQGGYKTYRRHVIERLHNHSPAFRGISIAGGTGVAKTEVLKRLAARGVQTLDLEDLAGHRGSLFGALPGVEQPSQKLFESRLLAALDRFDLKRPVIVEAESNRIGARQTPPAVWAAMRAAPEIELSAPPSVRARYLVSAYSDLIADPQRIETQIARLRPYHSREEIAGWIEYARTSDHAALAEALIRSHYDPAYARHRRKAGRASATRIELSDLSARSQEEAADQIEGLIERLAGVALEKLD
ncbi:MAG: tRNA 2-selenouridine(34) synthase MnmH [Pseudomonadota bacterium]